jgi:hypothetical protein
MTLPPTSSDYNNEIKLGGCLGNLKHQLLSHKDYVVSQNKIQESLSIYIFRKFMSSSVITDDLVNTKWLPSL